MEKEMKQGGVMNCLTVKLWIAIVAVWKPVLIVLTVINIILAWIFVLPPMFDRSFADHFAAVGFVLIMPFIETMGLALITLLEILAEDVLECIMPIKPRKGGSGLKDTAVGTALGLGGFVVKEVVNTAKETKKFLDLPEEEQQRIRVAGICDPVKEQFEKIVEQQAKAGYKLSAMEKRNLWYALQEFICVRRSQSFNSFAPSALEYIYARCPEMFKGMTEKQVSQEFVDFHFDVELDENINYNDGWYKRMLCQKIGKVLVEQRFKDGDIDKQYRQLYAAMEELCPGENI